MLCIRPTRYKYAMYMHKIEEKVSVCQRFSEILRRRHTLSKSSRCDRAIRETVLLSVTAHDYIIDIVHHRNVLIKMHIFRWR